MYEYNTKHLTQEHKKHSNSKKLSGRCKVYSHAFPSAKYNFSALRLFEIVRVELLVVGRYSIFYSTMHKIPIILKIITTHQIIIMVPLEPPYNLFWNNLYHMHIEYSEVLVEIVTGMSDLFSFSKCDSS